MKLPDLSDLVVLRAAAHGLSLHAHRPAMAQLYGGHRSAQRGRGLEFEEVRPYVPGDDARTIDWRVTARTREPHTKLFHEERERPVFVLVEQSQRLFFGSGLCFKARDPTRSKSRTGSAKCSFCMNRFSATRSTFSMPEAWRTGSLNSSAPCFGDLANTKTTSVTRFHSG